MTRVCSTGVKMKLSPRSASREALFALSRSTRVGSFIEQHGMRFGADQFVAGPTIDEGIATGRGLEEAGFRTYLIELGEDVVARSDVERVVDDYLRLLERLEREQLESTISIKLSHLGLAFSSELAYSSARRVVSRAAELKRFVRIDMESSAFVDDTIDVYRGLRAEGIDNVGVVIQAYLYRAADDLKALLPLQPNVRLVKGAYNEPSSVAFPRKRDVDNNYLRLADVLLREAPFTAIATHDERMIEHAQRVAAGNGRSAGEEFEYQMLFGVRRGLQLGLMQSDAPVRICVPFGPEWFPYLVRRLGERPANLLFGLKSIIRN
jgi:proline dehydrogenase